jgi:hypothetical protein
MGCGTLTGIGPGGGESELLVLDALNVGVAEACSGEHELRRSSLRPLLTRVSGVSSTECQMREVKRRKNDPTSTREISISLATGARGGTVWYARSMTAESERVVVQESSCVGNLGAAGNGLGRVKEEKKEKQESHSRRRRRRDVVVTTESAVGAVTTMEF